MKRLKNRWAIGLLSTALILTLIAGLSIAQNKRYDNGLVFPEPKVVTPGTNNSAPSDAVVLFDGKNFDAWKGAEKWKVDEDGGFTVKGAISTKEAFGDCQLHLEFATPKVVKGTGQGRGNNGIGLMGGKYEIQVLDSYENETYYVGQCASVYNQRPPMVNACRKPGEWQSYDIIFTAPKFDEAGKLSSPAAVTVIHNGIVVQNHTVLKGDTPYNRPPSYKKHPAKLPLVLMYHGNPIRFRNIWIREVNELIPKKK